MTDRDQVDPAAQLHFVMLRCLAARSAGKLQLPDIADLGLRPVVDVARRCADWRAIGRMLAPNLEVALADDPWREVFGLIGSIGESLSVGAACEVEVEAHRLLRSSGQLPVSMMIAQRFFSIAEAELLVGVAHRLANVVVRALAIDPAIRDAIGAQKVLAKWGGAHRPFSDKRDAWLSFNHYVAKALGAVVASSPHKSTRGLAAVLSTLAAGLQWVGLEENRGQDFHRWRVESSVMAGLDQQGGQVADITNSEGAVVGHAYGGDPVPYTLADGREDHEARISRAALMAVSGAVGEMLGALAVALEPISHGSLVYNAGTVEQNRGRRWDSATCACCGAE